MPAVLQHVRRIRDGLVQGVLKLTEGLGERNVAGRARFVAPGTLEVNGERIEAARVVIATGSRPIVPDAWRGLGDRILTTDDLFEQPDLPRRIAVLVSVRWARRWHRRLRASVSRPAASTPPRTWPGFPIHA